MTYNYEIKQNNPFSKVTTGFAVPEYIRLNPNNIATITTAKTPENDTFITNSDTKLQPVNVESKKPLGKIVLGSMLAVGAVGLFLTKGISGATAGKLRRWFDKLENNFIRSASKNKAMGHADEIIVKGSQRIRKLFSFSDAIANFTAVKDTLFHEITASRFLNINKKWGLQSVCDFFTKNILKITESAVDSKYRKVGNALESFEALLNKTLLDSNLSASRKREIFKLIDNINPTFRQGFSKSSRNVRLNDINTGLANLDKEVREALIEPFRKNGKTKVKDVYSSYITLKKAASTKKAHINAVNIAKAKLSNDIEGISEQMRTLANDLKHCFNPKDKNCRLLFGDLLEQIDKFKKLSGSSEYKQRIALKKEILTTLNNIKTKFAEFSISDKKGEIIKYTKEDTIKAIRLIGSIEEKLLNSNKKGLLQKILTEMKSVLPSKEYGNLKHEVNKINEMLNSATDIECGNMFNKIAESKVGSIPTDMLALGSTAAAGIWAVSKGKDKEEKIGATLKVGIPLLGSIGTYLYSGAKAFSGTTNLLFSAATVFILNRIGDAIFKYYQKRVVDKKSVKEIAKEAYSKATSVQN